MARAEFHRMIAERKAFPRNSCDYAYRTRAAQRLLAIIRAVPASEWVR